MCKQSKSKFNELGSLMIEAMAMLALISMVTPVLYKKAAERTTELQDINSASQMRSLVKSLDDYVRDHYDDIIAGRTVTQDCNTASVNYNNLRASNVAETKSQEVNINHFCEYLPYGFLDASKNAQDTKTFSSDYKVVLKKVDGGNGRQRVITAFLVSDPKDGNFPKLRASRIASMIGSNGGYVTKSGENASVLGTQGIWGIDNLTTDLGIAAANVKDGSVVVSSIQGIAAQGSADNENFLYRKAQTNTELNTMETTLRMGLSEANGQNIKNINQLIIAAGNAGNFEEGNAADNALYIKNGGMTVKGGIKAADSNFVVDTSGVVNAVQYVAGSFNASDNALNLGERLAASDTGFTLSYTNTGSWNSDTGLTSAPVNINSDTKIDGNLHVTGNEYIGGDLRIGGTLDADKLHARVQLSAGGDPSNPTNAVITENKSLFKSENFQIGSDANPRLYTSDSKTVLRGGSAGLLLESPDLVTMQATGSGGNIVITSGTSGNVDIHAGSGNLDMSSSAGVNIDSGTGPIALNGSMMKVDPSDVTIKSIVNSFLAGNTAAESSLTDNDSAYSITDVANRTLKTKKMNFEVADGRNNTVFKIDPGDTGISGRASLNEAYATMRGQLSVTDNDPAKVLLQVTPSGYVDDIAAVNVSESELTVNNVIDGSQIMTVDIKGGQARAQSRQSVYVRKGVIELAANTGNTAKNLSEHQGYVKADRFVANHALEANALNKPTDLGPTFVQQGDSGAYDHYQVNPAYTSVMHDIKLTTRGGARLSDILPDFINKGIYIIDNTYKAGDTKLSGGGWASVDSDGFHNDSTFKDNLKKMVKPSPGANPFPGDCGTTHSCEVSPWAGFVPAPQCPPGYMKVITLMPATFAMAEAGVPGPITAGHKPDLIVDYNVRDPHEYGEGVSPGSTNSYNKSGYVTTAPTPLYFQKNTWLRSQVIPYKEGTESNTFRGWSTVMGFIYPYAYYQKYVDLIGGTLANNGASDASKKIIWNVFPVWNQTLEGYATVYCYFNRNEDIWDDSLVDKTYDQLGNFRDVYNKNNTNYNKRLNDPTLGYTDPW